MAYRRIAEYGEDDFPSPGNGFSAIGDNTPKCNRFVADVAIEAGVAVPAIHVTPRLLIPDGTYPPLANEWANGDVPILGWTYLGRDVYPEPGFIAGHPAAGMGHCGIVDYDGWTINARQDGISRYAQTMLDGTCGYNKPTETNNEE